MLWLAPAIAVSGRDDGRVGAAAARAGHVRRGARSCRGVAAAAVSHRAGARVAGGASDRVPGGARAAVDRVLSLAGRCRRTRAPPADRIALRAGGRQPAAQPAAASRRSARADRRGGRPRRSRPGRRSARRPDRRRPTLAFRVWSRTASPTSARPRVELHDAAGALVSRFALDLPQAAGRRTTRKRPARGKSSRKSRRSSPRNGGCCTRAGASAAPGVRARPHRSSARSSSTRCSTTATCRSSRRRTRTSRF